MSTLKQKRMRARYEKLRRIGNRGYPIVTVAYYGPTDRVASKVVVALIPAEGEDIEEMERWTAKAGEDLRTDPATIDRIITLVDSWKPKSIAAADGIIGCPHEEGVDYPMGEHCPDCLFWKGRDRWTGELIQ